MKFVALIAVVSMSFGCSLFQSPAPDAEPPTPIEQVEDAQLTLDGIAIVLFSIDTDDDTRAAIVAGIASAQAIIDEWRAKVNAGETFDRRDAFRAAIAELRALQEARMNE